MKALRAAAVVGFSLMGLGVMGTSIASAQPYGGRDYGYGDRDDGYRERGRGYRDRDAGDRDGYSRGRDRDREFGRGGRDSAFDEREYLRCNPDVRQALRSGQITSALAHYQKFGRREGRRLGC